MVDIFKMIINILRKVLDRLEKASLNKNILENLKIFVIRHVSKLR